MNVHTYQQRDGKPLAILMHRDAPPRMEVAFPTPPDCTLQVGYMRQPMDRTFKPHVHLPREAVVRTTMEALVLLSGYLVATLYDDDKTFNCMLTMCPGDCILLMGGGHSFLAQTDVELYEVKQGPYDPANDKEYF